MRRSLRIATLVAVASLALAACGGGSDDTGDVGDGVEAESDGAVEEAASDDESGSSDDGESATEAGAGFGELASGTIDIGGAEVETYAIDDPSYVFRAGGGCGPVEFGFSITANDAASGAALLQLSASIDVDLAGGVTGTFDVEEIALAVVTDGDLAGSRTYEGPGTMAITEHDTGGASADPNARRMALTLDGTLEGTGPDNDGVVDLSADIVWVMGCP